MKHFHRSLSRFLVPLALFLVAGCGSIVAPPAGECNDGEKNGDETGIDCGGSACGACKDGDSCATGTDCTSGVCTNQMCVAAACTDNLQNGDETDLDCGGHCGAGSCQVGQKCAGSEFCISNACDNGICVDSPKRVFISSQLFTGNLGGLAGADMKCQSLAQAAGLTGAYMAWLSDSQKSPGTRFKQATIPYVLVDGTLVANSWADLIDNALINPISKDEKGQPAPASDGVCDAQTNWVMTGTRGDGTLFNVNSTCTNWTLDTGGGSWGRYTDLGDTWSLACNGGAPVNLCGKRAPIYCFEQ